MNCGSCSCYCCCCYFCSSTSSCRTCLGGYSCPWSWCAGYFSWHLHPPLPHPCWVSVWWSLVLLWCRLLLFWFPEFHPLLGWRQCCLRHLLVPMSFWITYTLLAMLIHCGVRIANRSRRPRLALCQPMIETLSDRLRCRMLWIPPKSSSREAWRFWRGIDSDTKRLCERCHPWRSRLPNRGLLLTRFGDRSTLR